MLEYCMYCDGSTFKRVSKIVAQGLHINSYQYNDTVTFTTNLYYRLKMITNNQQVSYSNTVRFQGNSITSNSSVFPNPTQDNLFLSVGDKSLIGSKAVLYDIIGKRIQEIMVTASMVNINLSYCAAGAYTLRLANGEIFLIIKNN